MTDRGVSIAVNYVMTLAIATILLSTLVVATGTVLEDRRESAIRTEMEIVGQRIAAGIASADRLVESGGTTVTVTVPNPRRVAGVQYTIEIRTTADGNFVRLWTDSPRVQVVVPFRVSTPIENATVAGGPVEIVLDDGKLAVIDA